MIIYMIIEPDVLQVVNLELRVLEYGDASAADAFQQYCTRVCALYG
jgi:hypothetical protein